MTNYENRERTFYITVEDMLSGKAGESGQYLLPAPVTNPRNCFSWNPEADLIQNWIDVTISNNTNSKNLRKSIEKFYRGESSAAIACMDIVDLCKSPSYRAYAKIAFSKRKWKEVAAYHDLISRIIDTTPVESWNTELSQYRDKMFGVIGGNSRITTLIKLGYKHPEYNRYPLRCVPQNFEETYGLMSFIEHLNASLQRFPSKKQIEALYEVGIAAAAWYDNRDAKNQENQFYRKSLYAFIEKVRELENAYSPVYVGLKDLLDGEAVNLISACTNCNKSDRDIKYNYFNYVGRVAIDASGVSYSTDERRNLSAYAGRILSVLLNNGNRPPFISEDWSKITNISDFLSVMLVFKGLPTNPCRSVSANQLISGNYFIKNKEVSNEETMEFARKTRGIILEAAAAATELVSKDEVEKLAKKNDDLSAEIINLKAALSIIEEENEALKNLNASLKKRLEGALC